MDDVQIIPFPGKTLEFGYEGMAPVRFPSSEYGFLLGSENSILEPLFQEIADGKIASKRQPIFLYGALGTGRTHLLKCLLEAWRTNQMGESVRRQSYYLTCADFHRQFTEAVGTRTTCEFRQRHCNAKLLLLDDLEQLLGKPAAQTELRLLLDAFASEEGIIVVTAQALPDEMKTGTSAPLSADLAVRIQAGTTIPIFPPGEAVRQRFLRDVASALGIPVKESLLKTAAKEMLGTIPQLYATVAQKYMELKVANEPLTSAFWEQFSRRRQSNGSEKLTAIAKRVAAFFSLKLTDLKGQSRCKTVTLARSLTVYLAKSQLNMTYKEIGQFFGKRDTSTVRHLFEKVKQGLQTDSELRDHLFRLSDQYARVRPDHR